MEKHTSLRKPNGLTIINHGIQYDLDLSLKEYCVADLIFKFNKVNKKGKLAYFEYYNKSYMLISEVQECFISLKEKGILVWDEKKCRAATSDLWNKHFSDTDNDFEELWSIHPKGGKAEALNNFMKMRDMIPLVDLKEKLRQYVLSNDDYKFLKDLSGWLNPKFKRWENPVEYKSSVNQEANKPKMVH